jgi:hypothetical protein
MGGGLLAPGRIPRGGAERVLKPAFLLEALSRTSSFLYTIQTCIFHLNLTTRLNVPEKQQLWTGFTMISFDKISRHSQGLLQRLSWHNIRFKIIHATCRLSCVHGGNRVLNPRTRLVKYRSSLAFWMLHPRFDYCRCCWRVYQFFFSSELSFLASHLLLTPPAARGV